VKVSVFRRYQHQKMARKMQLLLVALQPPVEREISRTLFSSPTPCHPHNGSFTGAHSFPMSHSIDHTSRHCCKRPISTWRQYSVLHPRQTDHAGAPMAASRRSDSMQGYSGLQRRGRGSIQKEPGIAARSRILINNPWKGIHAMEQLAKQPQEWKDPALKLVGVLLTSPGHRSCRALLLGTLIWISTAPPSVDLQSLPCEAHGSGDGMRRNPHSSNTGCRRCVRAVMSSETNGQRKLAAVGAWLEI